MQIPMKIRTSPLITRIKGTYGTPNAPAVIRNQRRPGLVLRPSSPRGFKARDSVVTWMQKAQAVVDDLWNALPSSARQLWGRHGARVRKPPWSALDFFRSVNKRRLMFGLSWLPRPPAPHHALKRIVTKSDYCPDLPAGKSVALWSEGAMEPFPYDDIFDDEPAPPPKVCLEPPPCPVTPGPPPLPPAEACPTELFMTGFCRDHWRVTSHWWIPDFGLDIPTSFVVDHEAPSMCPLANNVEPHWGMSMNVSPGPRPYYLTVGLYCHDKHWLIEYTSCGIPPNPEVHDMHVIYSAINYLLCPTTFYVYHLVYNLPPWVPPSIAILSAIM